MIKNYDFRPDAQKRFPKRIEFSDRVMEFPYEITYAVEMDDRVIVKVGINRGKQPPFDPQNIWCYRKSDQALLWKIQPPVDHKGQLFPHPYWNLKYWEPDGTIFATSDSFGYTINPEDGSITLVATGLR